MKLSSAQTATVATWVAAGANLSAIQKRLREEFAVSLTYMDVRFLVDDLNLQLKDPPKKADANDLSKTPAKAATSQSTGKAVPAPDAEATLEDDDALDDLPAEEALDDEPLAPSGVSVTMDAITLMPGALASGTVTFSDGVTGKWIIDPQGRPGFTQISKPGYRPTPADGQEFMRQLDIELQKKGY